MTRLFGLTVLAVATVGLARGSHAAPISYFADLNGLNEAQPNGSPGTGTAEVDFDLEAHSMRVQVTFSDLVGTTTASHIHAPTDMPGTGTAMVATQIPTFVDFPLGVTSGTYDHTFDTSQGSTYNPDFVTAHGGTAAGAEAALAASLAEGTA